MMYGETLSESTSWNASPLKHNTTVKHIQMDILAQGVASYRFFISVYKMVC